MSTEDSVVGTSDARMAILEDDTNEVRKRVEALESRFSAMEARMGRLERILWDVQTEQRLANKHQAEKLIQLEEMMKRVLELLQPRAVLPQPESAA